MQEPQIKRLFCKPICKPDVVKPGETGETEPTARDEICPVRRDHRTRKRRPETAETDVVWLITQRPAVDCITGRIPYPVITPPRHLPQQRGSPCARSRPDCRRELLAEPSGIAG